MKFSGKMLLIPLALMLVLAGCAQSDDTQAGVTTGTQGRAVFGIKDAAASMGAVTSVKITVESIQVQNAKGWITVSTAQLTYDLLKLKAEGTQALLADAKLEQGTYDQMRIVVSNVRVTDATGEHQAKLPSGELKIVGGFTVTANTAAAVIFDFIADESLHQTGKAGQYIFTPVIKVESKNNADVVIVGTTLTVDGGTVQTNITTGMNADAEMKENFNFGLGKKLEMGANNEIKVLDEVDSIDVDTKIDTDTTEKVKAL